MLSSAGMKGMLSSAGMNAVAARDVMFVLKCTACKRVRPLVSFTCISMQHLAGEGRDLEETQHRSWGFGALFSVTEKQAPTFCREQCFAFTRQ